MSEIYKFSWLEASSLAESSMGELVLRSSLPAMQLSKGQFVLHAHSAAGTTVSWTRPRATAGPPLHAV